MNLDLVVRSERVITPQGVRRAALHIRRGRIAAVADWESAPAGCPLYDAGRSMSQAELSGKVLRPPRAPRPPAASLP